MGIKNVVASSGTAFTIQQARLLARFAQEVYLFFDADSAGRNAALRSVDALYDAGLEVKVITPPQGEDPDSIAKQFGFDKIDELRSEAVGFIPFRVRDVDIRTTGIIGKEKLVKEFASLGAKIQDPTRRTLFYTEAANILGVDVQLLQAGPGRATGGPAPTAGRKRKYSPAEVDFISLLFNNPGSIDDIFEQISADDFDSKELSRLYAAMIDQYKAHGLVDAKKLIDNIHDENFASLVAEVALTEWERDKIESEARRLVKLMLEAKRKRIRQRLQKDLAQAEADGDNDKAGRILEELKSYGL